MRCPSVTKDEKGRLLALSQYNLDEKEVQPDLQAVAEIAARMLDTPSAAVNMIGSDYVFLAANVGIGECDMRRDVSFCAHAIHQNDVMVVLDATLDPRFHDNPLVKGPMGIRFYAGIPLHSSSGHALCALCVIDSRPHSFFSDRDRERLRDLARLASDKLELKRLENARHDGPFRFEDIAATSPTAILCFDHSRRITFWNRMMEELFGYRSGEIEGQPLDMVIPLIEGEPLVEMIDDTLRNEQPALGSKVQEVLGIGKDGTLVPIGMSFFRWTQGGRQHFGAIVTDLTERQRHEDEIFRLANFDSLTGLANRGLLQRRVVEELESGSPLSVIAIDLDNFKDVNDTLGGAVGDEILRSISESLLHCVRPVDTVARTGGDEFAILLPQVGDALRSSAVAEAVTATISLPLQVSGHDIRIAASCGVAISPAHGQDAEELMGNADLALYHAKSNGSGRTFLFTPSLRREAIERRRVDAELHRAVEDNQFELFYQPQVRITDGEVVGAEALIRWKHPERGYLTPAHFLASLDGGPLAGAVGTWGIDTACAQVEKWHMAGATGLRMGVNLFAAQFMTRDLVDCIRHALERHKLPAQTLELEITENIILNRDDLILEPLQQLRAMGVCIAFDDFGTGYASLSLLKNYPLTRIKIDQTFISNMCNSRRDEATVAATLDLARNYELEVIAEGVETNEQLEKLMQLRCDEAQGYLFGKPMPAAQFEELLGNPLRVE